MNRWDGDLVRERGVVACVLLGLARLRQRVPSGFGQATKTAWADFTATVRHPLSRAPEVCASIEHERCYGSWVNNCVIDCLYEDERMFVLNKPSGMLVHRGWGVAETALVDFARDRTDDGAAHPIQRLDRGASGPVLFARSASLAHAISDWAQAGRCQKDYLALVRGEVTSDMDIDYPISRREDGPRVPARTLVRRIASARTEPRNVSLVMATPLTGRLHQIRRHLKHVNHPLIGDVRYGKGDLNRAFRQGYGLDRLALHVYRWSVVPPGSEAAIGAIVPLPKDFLEPLLAMGFDLDPVCLENGLLPIGALSLSDSSVGRFHARNESAETEASGAPEE